jgi:hypothetical protein
LAGDVLSDPLLLINQTYGDLKHLEQFYEKLHKEIRILDNNHILFFSPAVSNNFGSGFKTGPGGALYNDRNVLEHHWYCPLDPNYEKCSIMNKVYYEEKERDLKRLKVGSFLGEFGHIYNINEEMIKTMDNLLTHTEKYLDSWAYWQLLELPK